MNSPKQNPISVLIHNILEHHPDHLYVFTDDSKDNDKTVCAAVLNKTIMEKALPTKSFIFTAEARAVDVALDIISKSKHKKFNIFTDSLSVLPSLINKKKLENRNYQTIK